MRGRRMMKNEKMKNEKMKKEEREKRKLKKIRLISFFFKLKNKLNSCVA